MRITTYHTELMEDRRATLVKDSACLYPGETLDTTNKVVNMLNTVFRMDKLAEEYMYMLAFNTKARLIGVFEISHGTVNSSPVNPREVFQRALLVNATWIIVAHNHPSGDPTLSYEDKRVLLRIKESGELLGISLMDFIVIGSDSYYSSKEQGEL